MSQDSPSPRSDISYLLRSSTWLNANSVVLLLCSFGISIAYANLLPKDVYGTYQYILSLFALLSAFTLTGMNAAITRSVAQGYEGVLQKSIPFQLRWNLISFAIALACAGYYFLHGDITLTLGTLCIAVALPITSAFNSYTAFLTGKKAFRHLFAYSTLGSLLYYLCIAAAVVYVPSAIFLVFINLFITALTTVAAYVVTVRVFKPGNESDPDVFTYGTHLTFMNLLSTAATQLDNILVFHFLGPIELARYSFATLIPERLSGFLKNITNSVLPRFAEQRFSNLRSSIWISTAFFALLILVGIIGYILVVPWFFTVAYPRYLDVIPYTQIFSLTLFAAVANYLGASLLAHRRIRRLYAINGIGPVVQLVLQVVGIVYWGLWGLVYARVIWTFLFLISVIPLVLFERNTS